MKLTFSPSSPYARKVRIAAIELGLIGKIELCRPRCSPAKLNEEYSRDISPLRKLPALILDNGTTIVDSYVIVEYLDELAGGGKLIPASGEAKWRVKTEHAITAGHAGSDAALPLRDVPAPGGEALADLGRRPVGSRLAGLCAVRTAGRTRCRGRSTSRRSALVCVLGYADFRFADCGWRKTYPKLAAFHETMMKRPSIKDTVPPPA